MEQINPEMDWEQFRPPTPTQSIQPEIDLRLLSPTSAYLAIFDNQTTDFAQWPLDTFRESHYPMKITNQGSITINSSRDLVDTPVVQAPIFTGPLSVGTMQFYEALPSNGSSIAIPQPMAPPPNLRKRKAPTLREEDWEPVKHRVIELHINQDLPLTDVKQIVEDEFEAIGFTATIRQYKSRLSGWGLDKNIKTKEMKAIVRKREYRRVVETNKRELNFRVRGVEVPVEKIDRFMKRNGLSEGVTVALSPDASTPSALSASTLSEQGSPAASLAISTAVTTMSYLPFDRPKIRTLSPAPSSFSDSTSESSSFTGQSPVMSYRAISSGDTYNNQSLAAISQPVTSKQHRYLGEEEDRARQELSAREALWGEGHPETLYAMAQLGEVLRDQGRYRSAEKISKNLVSYSQENYGEDSEETLRALAILGSIFRAQGLYPKAEKVHRKVSEVANRVLGPEHQLTLNNLTDLATALRFQALFPEAETILREVIAISQKVLGAHHLVTLTSKFNLANVLSQQNLCSDAETIYREMLAVKEILLGFKHAQTWRTRHNLAYALFRQERYEEAEMIIRQTIATRENELGPEHPDTLASTVVLANILIAQNLREEAATLYKRAVVGRIRVLGRDHPLTRSCQEAYSAFLAS